MAEIPVEKKEGGFPWWLIPLILLLLLVPLFLLMRNCDNGTTANVNNTTNRTVVTTNSGNGNSSLTTNSTTVVTNTSNTTTTGVNGMGNGSSMNGMNSGNSTSGANISGNSTSSTTTTGETITDVNYFGSASDKSTLVGRGINLSGVVVNRVVSDRVFTVKSGAGEMFVMLDDALNAGGKEKQIQIKRGQRINLGGSFRNVPTAEVKDEAQNRDLNAKNYAQMKGQNVYLHATGVSDAK